jgi:CSLREA domain-containing protein
MRPLFFVVASSIALAAAQADTLRAATITVTTATDENVANAVCSLREALIAAASNAAHNGCPAGSADPTVDRIAFAIPPLDGTVKTITVSEADLPPLDGFVHVDGYSQFGAVVGLPLFITDRLKIEIVGEGAVGTRQRGLLITGDEVVVEGLAIGNFQTGIEVSDAASPPENVEIAGNFIGFAADGVTARGNGNPAGGGLGILVGPGSSFVAIGPNHDPNDEIPDIPNPNVIGNNPAVGVMLEGSDLVTDDVGVSGNYIGVDATGGACAPNGIGVLISGSVVVTVIDNVISCNTSFGINTQSAAEHITGIAISSNLIGRFLVSFPSPDPGGPAPNGSDGVRVFGTSNVELGSNTIHHNGGAGIAVVTGPGGVLPHGVSIAESSLHLNAGLGIDLGDDGPDTNDAGDADDGPNRRQNRPTIASAEIDGSDQLVASGTLATVASELFYLDYYANSITCGQGAEAETSLGSDAVVTDGSGNGSWSVSLGPGSYPPGTQSFSLTATRDAAPRDTSEIECFTIGEEPPPGTSEEEFSVTSYTVSETAGTVTLFVTRIGDVSSAQQIEWATADGTAAAGEDYQADSGSLTWGAGDGSTRQIVVDILDDAAPEPSESFTVELSQAPAAVLRGSPLGVTRIASPVLGDEVTATVTIVDDDGVTATSAVPTLGTWSLLLLAAGLGLVAARRLRI